MQRELPTMVAGVGEGGGPIAKVSQTVSQCVMFIVNQLEHRQQFPSLTFSAVPIRVKQEIRKARRSSLGSG